MYPWHLRAGATDAIEPSDGIAWALARPAFFHLFRGRVPKIMRDSVAVKRSSDHAVKSSAEDIVQTFLKSVDSGKRSDQPYRHWSLQDCLPADTVDDILALPFEAPSIAAV